MDKKELREQLERDTKRFTEVYGGEVVKYAAPPKPERKPWKRRPSLRDLAYAEELRKAEDQRSD
ncbi:hypothetical protein AO946_26110 [Pseudomonas aeruginosa]|jgi:hypothetical protein|uniref:Beta-ketoadipyl CoA thiolase n=1 Tax=Pseudomonas nitroreducens TaxID=46680 RepID=A0ABS0KVW8_PSENT|nr:MULTISPECIES: hypothetical protein [Pseudomonas]EKU4839403.1 hypothetical protein [Pseudomonas aeruginosa]EKW0098412.1 hypothetical protein [Pseudomonas aeruginosa]EKW6685846.1 hypothetical protein [Pseudomonas aeruginosa]EKX0550641.1 hypothetical protein [Pseudomonas aeruginosa]EKX6189959.1 hypothetical protein [Pseudomonas aeruginosa]